MIVGLNVDPVEGSGYACKEGDFSTREGNRRNPLIRVGYHSTIMKFCLVPDRACCIRDTASRAGPRWPLGSGVGGPTWRFLASSCPTIGVTGPAAIRFILTWGSGSRANDGVVSESTRMGPMR